MDSRNNSLWMILIFSFLGFTASTKASSKIKQELETKLKLYNSLKSLKVPFIQNKTFKSMDFTIKSKGLLNIIWPSKVIWEVKEPSKMKVTLDKNKISIETTKTDGKIEKEIYESNESFPMTKFLKPLSSLLSLNFNDLFKYYTILKVKSNKYKLIPKDDSNLPFKHLFIYFRKKNILNSFEVIEKSGDQLVILFGKPNFKKR